MYEASRAYGVGAAGVRPCIRVFINSILHSQHELKEFDSAPHSFGAVRAVTRKGGDIDIHDQDKTPDPFDFSPLALEK